MKSETSSAPQVLQIAVFSLPSAYSNWYVGVSHCRQIRYSGSSLIRGEFYSGDVDAFCTVAITGSMKRASFVAFSITDA